MEEYVEMNEHISGSSIYLLGNLFVAGCGCGLKYTSQLFKLQTVKHGLDNLPGILNF